ncbi:beta-hexosaminidase subunit alpha-like isoform X2 [Littorina saxatilis]|uniref:Beta-hexosaminidase n=1 Tax=Littorina saxatilis TaxID=31220 RepID=A0AAN9C3A7_9CAEN
MTGGTMKMLLFLFWGFLFSAVSQAQEIPTAPSRGQPWPMPMSYKAGGQLNTIDAATFRFATQGNDCDILREAYIRYREAAFKQHSERLLVVGPLRFRQNNLRFMQQLRGQENALLQQLSVQVSTPCEGRIYPSLESDESYALDVSGGQATLKAQEVWGALWGLETFVQLVYTTNSGEFVVNDTSITDKPRFVHRGMLLDTGRHFLPKRTLLQNLDAMAQNKLNVFHWHIVDDPSFPYESRAFPELSNKGSFYPGSHIYTPSDIQEIIEFARLRGIRVMAEFDTPGHARSWEEGQKGFLSECYSGGTRNGMYGPADPTKNSTFTFLKEFFTEVASVFPDQYIHVGGDEVNFTCWQSNPAVGDFMQKMGFGDNYAKLEEYYMQNLLDIINSLGRGYMIWQEVIDNGAKVREDTVVMVWKGGWQKEMANVTKQGYHTLLSSCWYLNLITYGEDWKTFYTCDPHAFDGTDAQKSLVMGGELAMWGEYVDDTNVLPLSWPRGSAVAERLWSPQDVNSPVLAEPRLVEQRCRMVRRGIPAQPISGAGGCPEEFGGN